MIKTKADLTEYLAADAMALRYNAKLPFFKRLIEVECATKHLIWRYQKTLRYCEYYCNQNRSLINRCMCKLYRAKLNRLQIKTGFEISPNVFGKGLCIVHTGSIVVSQNAKVGDNCRLYNCVTIGGKAGTRGVGNFAPHIGNNCWIGPGVRIFNPIKIADNVAIGANSVVNKSVDEDGITIAGAPAKKVSDEGSYRLINISKHN